MLKKDEQNSIYEDRSPIMAIPFLFEPIKKAHAVAETVLFFEFGERVLPEQHSAQKVIDSLGGFFSRVEQVPRMEINVDQFSGPIVQQHSDSISFVKAKTGGQPQDVEWVARIIGNHVSIHCVEYTRWDAVSEETLKYLKGIVSSLEGQNPIISFGLKVIDRFAYTGTPENYNISALMNPDSSYLTKHIFGAGNRWHVNTGWFDPSESKGEEVLSQLNIDSSIHKGVGDQNNHIITIDHTAALRSSSAAQRESLRRFDWKSDDFIDLVQSSMRTMHKRNKRVVFDLLQPAVAKKMNLSLAGD